MAAAHGRPPDHGGDTQRTALKALQLAMAPILSKLFMDIISLLFQSLGRQISLYDAIWPTFTSTSAKSPAAAPERVTISIFDAITNTKSESADNGYTTGHRRDVSASPAVSQGACAEGATDLPKKPRRPRAGRAIPFLEASASKVKAVHNAVFYNCGDDDSDIIDNSLKLAPTEGPAETPPVEIDSSSSITASRGAIGSDEPLNSVRPSEAAADLIESSLWEDLFSDASGEEVTVASRQPHGELEDEHVVSFISDPNSVSEAQIHCSTPRFGTSENSQINGRLLFGEALPEGGFSARKTGVCSADCAAGQYTNGQVVSDDPPCTFGKPDAELVQFAERELVNLRPVEASACAIVCGVSVREHPHRDFKTIAARRACGKFMVSPSQGESEICVWINSFRHQSTPFIGGRALRAVSCTSRSVAYSLGGGSRAQCHGAAEIAKP
jgi:hypothetical protein